jgi:hypothetical protein
MGKIRQTQNENASDESSKSGIIGHNAKVKKDKKFMKLEATQMKNYIEKMIKGEIFCIEWLHGCDK